VFRLCFWRLSAEIEYSGHCSSFAYDRPAGDLRLGNGKSIHIAQHQYGVNVRPVIGCNDAGKGWWSSGNMDIYSNHVQKFVGPSTSDAHRTSHIRTVKEIGRPYSGDYPAGIANKKENARLSVCDTLYKNTKRTAFTLICY
jgi:hypothetical protein